MNNSPQPHESPNQYWQVEHLSPLSFHCCCVCFDHWQSVRPIENDGLPRFLPWRCPLGCVYLLLHCVTVTCTFPSSMLLEDQAKLTLFSPLLLIVAFLWTSLSSIMFVVLVSIPLFLFFLSCHHLCYSTAFDDLLPFLLHCLCCYTWWLLHICVFLVVIFASDFFQEK